MSKADKMVELIAEDKKRMDEVFATERALKDNFGVVNLGKYVIGFKINQHNTKCPISIQMNGRYHHDTFTPDQMLALLEYLLDNREVLELYPKDPRDKATRVNRKEEEEERRKFEDENQDQ